MSPVNGPSMESKCGATGKVGTSIGKQLSLKTSRKKMLERQTRLCRQPTDDRWRFDIHEIDRHFLVRFAR